MAGLGDLVVRLSAETAQFTEALNKASYQTQKNMGMISNSVKTAGLAIGSYLSADALIAFARSSIDAQDELFKMSQKVGVATDELSKLQYAAKLSDVNSQQLQVGLVKLSRGLSDAADDSGEARNALNAMGISIKNADGSLKSADQVLGDVAEKFASYRDGVNKTAVATQLFGRSGADLIPLLNAGRDGLKEAGDELYRFGGVVMPEAAKQAEIFNDNITKLGTIAGSAGRSIVNELLSPINKVIGLLFAINKVAAEKQMSFWDFLKPPTKETAGAFLEVEKLWEKYKGTAEETAKTVKDAPIIPDLKKIEAGTSALNKLVEASINNLEAQTRQSQLSMATVGMTDAQKKAVEDLVKIYELQVEKESQINELLTAKKITQEQATSAIKALNTASDEARVKAEDLLRKQEELNSSWEYGATTALSKYANESANVAKIVETSFTNAFKSMEDSLVSMVENGKLSFKSFADSIISDLLRIAVRQGITAPLASALGSIFSPSASSSITLGSSALGNNPSASTGFGVKLATGTNYVPYDNFPALLHKGEAVVPAQYNPMAGNGGSTSVVVNNYSNANATTNETIDSRGNRRIEVIVGELVSAEVRRSGSQMNSAMKETFGASPALIRR